MTWFGLAAKRTRKVTVTKQMCNSDINSIGNLMLLCFELDEYTQEYDEFDL